MQKVLWQITTADLVDNYKEPTLLGDLTLRVPPAGGMEGPCKWPLFHPSEADAEAGYRSHPYTIEFELEQEPAGAYVLKLDYLVIAPRLAFLEVKVNSVAGNVYLRPRPSQSGEIRLLSGLHTTIYSDGVAEVTIPAALLKAGTNRMELVARDGGEFIQVDRIEAIKRLDRMANGAGFLYQGLSLRQEAAGATASAATLEVEPTVLYRRAPDGALLERCDVYAAFGGTFLGGTVMLSVTGVTTAVTFHPVAFGHALASFDLPDGPDETVPFLATGAGFNVTGELRRRRKWNVYITPHAHTDIGYTHRQWEVAERLCRNIDYALDVLASDKAGSFTYHLDSSWVLENYLATRSPERRRQFFAAVRAGKIGVAANYVDLLTQFAGLEDLVHNTEVTEQMLRPEGIATDFASVVDVASLSASMPALLQGAGVKYLVHANNQDRGPFRLNGGLHKVSPFWWEGTAGGKVLVWLSKMYCELRKVCGSPPVLHSAENGLGMWLQEYEHGGYAPDAVLLYGQEADNTDMDPQPVSFVERWNATYEYPKLIPSDVSSFFRYVEERWGAAFTVVKGDGGAYWEDGAGSSIGPTIQVREAQASLPAAERLESLAVLHTPDWAFPTQTFDTAWRETLLYDEHTWGAFLSARDPEAWLQRDQWAVKEGFATNAQLGAQRLLHVAAVRHSLNWNNDGREVVVYNPHSWSAAGVVQVELEPNEVVVDAATGAAVPMRRIRTLNTQAWVEFSVDRMPGLSYRRFVLQRLAGGSPEPDTLADATVLENEHYRLKLDPKHGYVTSWFDKALGRELVDPADPWGFGQFLYASGGEGTRLISNQADLPDGNPVVSTAFVLISARAERWAYGQRVVLSGRVPGGEVDLEWSLPDNARRVDLICTYHKNATPAKEAVYVAFPTALGAGARVESDSQLGWVDWDKEQLPGGCKEWLPLQTGMLVTGSGAAVHIASPDIPLFCVGDVVRGRWPKTADLTGGRVLSYVLNNYWHTNYVGQQGGEITFRYSLTSGEAIAKADAYRLGWEARRPLYAHRMSFQDFRPTREPYNAPTGGLLAEVGGKDVVLSTIRPARQKPGFLVRLQEIGGAEGAVGTVAIPGRRIAHAWITDLAERHETELPVAADGTVTASVSAWGLTTIRIEMEDGRAV